MNGELVVPHLQLDRR